MIRNSLIVALLTISNTVSFAQHLGSFKDPRDGRVYKTVRIGEQVWMAENLNVSKFRNGDLIPEAKTKEEWKAAGENKQPAWCYYDNDKKNGEKYGKLYNWYAINDRRGVIPEGWHLPSDEEISTLKYYLYDNKNSKVEISLEVDYSQIISALVNRNADSIFLSALKAAKIQRTQIDQDFPTLLFDELLKIITERDCIKYFSPLFNSKTIDNNNSLEAWKNLVADTLDSSFNEIVEKTITTLKALNIPAEVSRIKAKAGYMALLIDSNHKKQWRDLFLLKKDILKTMSELEDKSLLNYINLLTIVQECKPTFKDSICLIPTYVIPALLGSRMQNGDYNESLNWYGQKNKFQEMINYNGSQRNKVEFLSPVYFFFSPCYLFTENIYETQYGMGRYIRCIKD